MTTYLNVVVVNGLSQNIDGTVTFPVVLTGIGGLKAGDRIRGAICGTTVAGVNVTAGTINDTDCSSSFLPVAPADGTLVQTAALASGAITGSLPQVILLIERN
jgi:hypothetical protein